MIELKTFKNISIHFKIGFNYEFKFNLLFIYLNTTLYTITLYIKIITYSIKFFLTDSLLIKTLTSFYSQYKIECWHHLIEKYF